MRKLSWICFVVLFAFAFFSCDENGGKGGGGVSEVIGPEGGTITSRDGRLTLTFPPGALSEDTEIMITDIKGGEVRAESDGLEPQFTYQLEPDGIEFNAPVTASFLTDETPVQGDGSIVTDGALLFTSSNGQIELLENLTQEVNADEDTTSVSGELSHFSELSESESGINVTVNGVPDSLPVGGTFNADVNITSLTTDTTLDFSTYIDKSIPPILFLLDKTAVFVIPFPDPGKPAQRSFPYKCFSEGDGFYSADIRAEFNHPLDPEDTVFQSFVLSKGVSCVNTPPPPPVEVCAKLGSYVSMSAGCGIGTFTISDNTSNELTVTGFGANPGDVKFMQLPLEPTVFSSNSDNLVIFGQDGHECSLTCGPEDGQLTLHCQNPPAMCTEIFTLQQ